MWCKNLCRVNCPWVTVLGNCMSLSMHLLIIDVMAMSQKSCVSLASVFLGMGIVGDVFLIVGTALVSINSWKSLESTCPSCSAQTFKILPPSPSGPAALWVHLLQNRHHLCRCFLERLMICNTERLCYYLLLIKTAVKVLRSFANFAGSLQWMLCLLRFAHHCVEASPCLPEVARGKLSSTLLLYSHFPLLILHCRFLFVEADSIRFLCKKVCFFCFCFVFIRACFNSFVIHGWFLDTLLQFWQG